MTQDKQLACATCGIKPARFIKLRSVVSWVVIWRPSTVSGVLCPVCAEAAYAKVSRTSGRLGWWGPLPFFATLVALTMNSRAIRSHREALPHYKDSDARLTNRRKYKLTHDNPTLALSVVAIGAGVLFGMNLFEGTQIGQLNLTANADSHLVDWQSVSVGDCMNTTGGLTVDLVSCEGDHHWQVFEQFDSQSPSFDNETLGAEADRRCGEAQSLLDTTKLAALEKDPTVAYYVPSSPSWDQGERTITCIIGADDLAIKSSLITP